MSETRYEKNRIYKYLVSLLYNDIKDFMDSNDGKDLTYIEIAAILDKLSKHFRDNSIITDIPNMTDVMIMREIRKSRLIDKYCKNCQELIREAGSFTAVTLCEKCSRIS